MEQKESGRHAPSAMAFIAATVTTYVGLVAGLARITSDANQMDILTILGHVAGPDQLFQTQGRRYGRRYDMDG